MGTWALPNTYTKAKKIAKFMELLSFIQKKKIKIDNEDSFDHYIRFIENVFGDDDLFADLKRKNWPKDWRNVIKKHLRRVLKDYARYPRDFSDKFSPDAIAILKKISRK